MNKRIFNRNYIFIVVSATFFYIAAFMLNSITGRFSRDLGAGKTMGGVVTAAFTLSSFFTRPLWGYRADKKSRKLVYMAGAVLCMAGAVLLIFTKNIILLILVRLIFGLGYSAVTTAGSTIVCDVTEEKLLGRAIAFYGVTNVASQAFAPGLALAMYENGFMLLAWGIAAIMALVLVTAFFIKYNEGDYTNPEIRFGIVEKSALPRAYVIFPFAMAAASVYSFIPLMAEERNIADIGWFFTVSAGALLVSRVFNAQFLSRFGRNKVYYAGNILFIAGFLLLAFSYNIFTAIGAALLYGLGAGFVHPVVNTAAVSDCEKEERGLATGTFMMSQDLGMTIGALLWGFAGENFGFEAVYAGVALAGVIMLILFKKLLKNRKT